MSRLRTTAMCTLVTAIGLAACSSGSDVTAHALAQVVEREGIPFDGSAIPADVVSEFAESEVVLLGETHHLREHWAFVADLTRELHPHGFRQLLIEAPQMAGWLFDDYVQGGLLAPDWQPSAFWESRLSGIAAVNHSLSPDERIHVRGIDANEQWYGGADAFRSLLGYRVGLLPEAGVDLGVTAEYATSTPEAQTAAVDALLTSLAADRSALAEAWGADTYDEVVRMVEVEQASIDVRARRADDEEAGARAREQVIKQLADESIAACPCRTVINIGGHHAQKSHLMGTDQEWLGDYLAHTSKAIDGAMIVVGFASARTELEPGAGGTPWDVLDSASPDNEVYRVIAETWPGHTVFVSLDDPLFAGRVAFNSEDVIYATSIRDQYDALIQYGLAHRMPEE
jgi:hypothetical protein